jgi:hypothetical protein
VNALFQGVVVCVTSLVMALAQDNLDAYAVCYTKAVDRLHRVSIATLPFSGISNNVIAGHRSRVLSNLFLLQSSFSMAPSETPSAFTILPTFRSAFLSVQL